MIDRVKNLSLNRVKERERKERFVAGVLQCCHGQWVEIEQLGVRWMYLGEDQVLERDGDSGFGTQPAIGDSSDYVLGWEGLGYGNGKDQFLWITKDDLQRDRESECERECESVRV